MSDPIRVLIVDDHPVVREGLRGMLESEPDIDVAGEASSGAEAVARAAAFEFDVVLMDLRMPGGDGASAIAHIVEQHPTTRVIVLTTYETHSDILSAIEAGAAGYLLKGTGRAELVGAIRSAHRGGTVMSPSAATKLVDRTRQSSGGVLSTREKQVLKLVGDGLTNARIGECLFISEATVKTHILRIFHKLGVSDRTAAVTRGFAEGILPPPGEPR